MSAYCDILQKHFAQTSQREKAGHHRIPVWQSVCFYIMNYPLSKEVSTAGRLSSYFILTNPCKKIISISSYLNAAIISTVSNSVNLLLRL